VLVLRRSGAPARLHRSSITGVTGRHGGRFHRVVRGRRCPHRTGRLGPMDAVHGPSIGPSRLRLAVADEVDLCRGQEPDLAPAGGRGVALS